MAAWEKQLQRTEFKANKSTKVYSNHFASGYCCDTCENPILYMKGYPGEGNNVKARENINRENENNIQSQLPNFQWGNAVIAIWRKSRIKVLRPRAIPS